MTGVGERYDELCMFNEVMRGIRSVMHVEAFGTMIWH